nr:hypothetical protein [Dehalococcoidia bacterium]
MPRSTQITDNEGQLEDLIDSPDILIPVTANNLDGDESEDDELGERTASDVLRSSVVAASASELETWGTKQPEGFAELNFNPYVEDSEISDDPVRMYLREIGRVGLLTASDERFLARGMEISQRLSEVQGEMAERTGQLPTAAEITLELFKRVGSQRDVGAKIASFAGLQDLTLGTLLGIPELRHLIDGPHDETLVAYLSDAFNCELQQAQDMVKDLSCDSALIALESLDALDADPNLNELAKSVSTKVYGDRLEVYEFLFAAHFSRIRDSAERSGRHL